MRDLSSRSGRRLMVEIAVSPPFFGLSLLIGYHGSGFIPLVHLDALRVELYLLEVEGCLSSLSGSNTLWTRITEARNSRRDRILSALDPETGVQRSIVEPRLVSPQHDLFSDGRPLLRIALEKFWAGPAFDSIG